MPRSASSSTHRLHHLVRMQALEQHPRLRVGGHERLHVPAHVVQPDRVDGGHPHRAVDALPRGGQLGPRLLEALQQGAAGLVEGLPLLGGQERAARAVQQDRVQLALELLDGLARRGLGDRVGGGAAGEAPEPDHVAVELEGLEVHGAKLPLLVSSNDVFSYFVLG